MLLEKMVKEYGITRLAYELGLCELSVRNKVTGRTKITPPEWMAIQKLLHLTEDQTLQIKEELRDGNSQSKDTISSI
jgi:plasmid maintenance system antidote protein VapI